LSTSPSAAAVLSPPPKTSWSSTCKCAAAVTSRQQPPLSILFLGRSGGFDSDIKVKEAIGSACSAQVQAVTAAFELAWSNPSLQPLLFKLFNTSPSRLTKADFAWMLADSAAMGDQYGCTPTQLSSSFKPRYPIKCNDVAARYKADMCGMLAPADAAPMDALAAFAKWTSTHYGDLANQCYYSTSCLSDVSQKAQWYNQKTWVWQCCSQLAYWQVVHDALLCTLAYPA
jgi:hypothetical protein